MAIDQGSSIESKPPIKGSEVSPFGQNGKKVGGKTRNVLAFVNLFQGPLNNQVPER